MASIEERFSAALHYCARAWRLGLDRRLKHLGLGQAGWVTIAIVAKSEEPLSQSDLANRVGVEGATMVAMIDRLMRAGLVERQASPTDRRVKFVVLTEAGRALYADVKTEADAFRLQLLAGEDPVFLQQVTEFLERLRDTADAH